MSGAAAELEAILRRAAARKNDPVLVARAVLVETADQLSDLDQANRRMDASLDAWVALCPPGVPIERLTALWEAVHDDESVMDSGAWADGAGRYQQHLRAIASGAYRDKP